MAKKVVIIESPGKLSTFKKYLGAEFDVVASYGHCVDLPEKKISVNIKNNFEPTFDVLPGKANVVKDLKAATKNASCVYLMTDPDREGEAISYHLKNLLSKTSKAKFVRAVTNEITSTAIHNGIKNAGEINDKLIEAYICRRILDRLVGYKTSFITKQSTGGKSAGRVQSAMLRIICDREQEINNFKPEEYWIISAKFKTNKNEVYTGFLDEKIHVPNEEKATAIYSSLLSKNGIVANVHSVDAELTPYAPFTTNTLIQSASTYLGWSAHKTMKIAQDIYEEGLISYMRTDSVVMSQEAVNAIREFILHKYSNDYLANTQRVYSSKVKTQEGHECCRPTDISKEFAASGDKSKLYTLIWKRAVASQMVNGIDKRTKITTKLGDYDFITKGNIVILDGYRKCWDYSSSTDVLVPNVNINDIATVEDLTKEQKFTSPPHRYSDASFSKKCESLQITRPSTFASFLKTLEAREYIERDKKTIKATNLGMKVADFLVASKFNFVDLQFTSKMEQDLDQIANGCGSRNQILSSFWESLKSTLENAASLKKELQKTKYVCPKCQGMLLLKHSQYGAFYSCENYSSKKCAYIAKYGKDGEPIEKTEQKKTYADFVCKYCSSKMILRSSQKGSFFGCSKYPKCKCIASLDGVFQDNKPKWKKKTNN